jgi:hypothetical protein
VVGRELGARASVTQQRSDDEFGPTARLPVEEVLGGEGEGDGPVVVPVGVVFDAVLARAGFDDADVDEFVDELVVVGE